MAIVDRIIHPNSIGVEKQQDKTIRPKELSGYIAQNTAKQQLEIFIQAAHKRQEPLDHTLIFGPPGLGKTTLANIIANEMKVSIKSTSGPVLEKQGDLAAILTNLEENDVLFIDEIHRLSPNIEEILYPAMEDYKLDIMIGEGPAARSLKLDLPSFTLIGATTRAGALTSPLRDRFGIILRLEYYNPEDLSSIINRNAKLLNTSIEDSGCYELAKRSRGTPRIANRLLRRTRDFAEIKNQGYINQNIVNQALSMLVIDQQGFDNMDRRLLTTIINNFSGGPVGLDSLAATLGEEKSTIEDVLEPFLIQQGFLIRTSRGRVATEKSYLHFNLEFKQDI